MKQIEKAKQTYNRILNAALIEFGTKSYDKASLNAICSKNNIPKGLIYHNFKNKEELYLCCVKECFFKLTDYLKKGEYSQDNAWDNMIMLFELRQEFFEKNPNYSKIFFQTIFIPPNHLLKQIKDLKYEFDTFHIQRFKELLKNIKLRDNITDAMATEYFLFYQEMFNRYFQKKTQDNEDFLVLIMDHEIKLLNMLNIMLYGIAEPSKKLNKIK